MQEVVRALLRSLKAFARGRVWRLILGPALVALVVGIGLALFALDYLIGTFIEQPPLSWMVGWGALWLAKVLAAVGGWLLVLAVSYVIATLIAALVVMPQLIEHVAAEDYPDLARDGRDSLLAAALNSCSAVVLFVAGWLLTLPVWLIPGLALLLPILWMAWLTRRTFAYDALTLHASDEEWRRLRREHAFPMLILGVIIALLAHVPLLGLLMPTFAALCYTYYGLAALRRLRQPSDGLQVGIQATPQETNA